MLDYLRNLTKSAEEKQQEALNAYLDDALSAKERQQFEQLLARDVDLRQVMEQRRALQAEMRQMPHRRVPRNFTLDPAVYGRPQRQPLFQLYPAMQAAVVLTALFLILAVGSELFIYGQGGGAEFSSAPAQDVAMMADEVVEEEAASETAVEIPLAAPADEVVAVTRVVTEVVVEEGEAVVESMAEEEMAEAAGLAEEEAPMMAAEAPAPPQADETTTESAEADDGGTDREPAATAPLPTPSPAPTLTAPAIDATKSTAPRPGAATVASERAVTAAPTDQPQAMEEAVVIEPTVVPLPPPPRERITGLRWLQMGLGVLLILLVTAVLYVRRQTF